MKQEDATVHPYIPNSVPETREEMLSRIGAESVEELYEDIPEELRLHRLLNLPQPLLSEIELKRHVAGLLSKNVTCQEFVSFLGAGCYNHYVPAVCDEINQRSEFLTAYAGEPYDDHGRFQALFEYQSMMGELFDMDVVNVPTTTASRLRPLRCGWRFELPDAAESWPPKRSTRRACRRYVIIAARASRSIY